MLLHYLGYYKQKKKLVYPISITQNMIPGVIGLRAADTWSAVEGGGNAALAIRGHFAQNHRAQNHLAQNQLAPTHQDRDRTQ